MRFWGDLKKDHSTQYRQVLQVLEKNWNQMWQVEETLTSHKRQHLNN